MGGRGLALWRLAWTSVQIAADKTMSRSLSSKRPSPRCEGPLGGEAAHRLSRVSSPTSSRAASHLADLIGSLTDAQLDVIGFRQRTFSGSIEWIAQLVVRHIDEHHAGIRAGLTPT